jgi:chaperone required for assembly of F1-ATPase
MSDWALKRFWKTATAEAGDAGYDILLDGRPVRTPAKAKLSVPGKAMAETIAAEWEAQTEQVDPTTMPFTRSANAAIDKVTIQHAEVADMLAGYGDSDLLCYRADHPEELVERQTALWDPILDWAAQDLGVRLEPRVGVMHAPQSPEALKALSEQVHALNAFELTAFHDLVSMTGSLILGFAATRDIHDAEDIWQLSRLDENYQEEKWGVDEEAAETAAYKKAEFLHAHRFYRLGKADA